MTNFSKCFPCSMQIFKYDGKNINKECDISMNKTIYNRWRITIKNQGTYKLSLYCCPIFKILTSQTFFAKPSVKLTINHYNQPENWTFYFKLIWFWTKITYDKFYFFISLFSRLCDCILTIIRTWYWANITTMLISLVMKIQIFMEASI